jgi:hypothetical protein
MKPTHDDTPTVWRVLCRHGKSRRERAPWPPANRYEYGRAGALVHLDAKQLGRFWQVGKRILGDGFQRNRQAGWQHAHVAVDDHSRLVVCSSTRARTTQVVWTSMRSGARAFLGAGD